MDDDWLNQLEKALVQAAEDTDRLLTTAMDNMLASADEMVDDLETHVDQALDTLDQVIAPWATSLTSTVSNWFEEISAPINQTVDPWLQEHPRCIGCRNYHGQFYGGEMLICAIHPYGPDPDVEKCPDWESHWTP